LPTPPAAVIVPPSSEVPGHACQPSPSGDEGWLHRWAWWKGHSHAHTEESDDVPLGLAVHTHAKVMVANGIAAQLVLYHFDFVDGQSLLNHRGYDQLLKIVRMLGHNPAPLVIERTPWQPGLAEARRLAILNELARNGCPLPPERVVIGRPLGNGLSGPESEIIYRNFLFRVRSEGSQPIVVIGPSTGTGGGGGGVGGGFGGQGGGGGGVGGGGFGGGGFGGGLGGGGLGGGVGGFGGQGP
jgi:hypothetical protein